MMARALGLVLILLVQHGSGRGLPEESVVSVYTTLPSTPPHQHQQDVYHQIASNIADRITSPIYRFLGFGNATTTTAAPWKDAELLDDPDDSPDLGVDNDITSSKDVEELSPEARKKVDRKPEKITLFSSYLPGENSTDAVASTSDAVETFGFEDDDVEDDSTYKPRDGPFVHFLELIGSFIALLYGGIVSLFSGSRSS